MPRHAECTAAPRMSLLFRWRFFFSPPYHIYHLISLLPLLMLMLPDYAMPDADAAEARLYVLLAFSFVKIRYAAAAPCRYFICLLFA